MNEHENEYRGCRLHRYLVAETTPTERQALREAIQRVNTEGTTQIVLVSCCEVNAISRLDAARLRRIAEKRRAQRIRHLLQTVCCWLAAACLFIAWGVAGSVECGTRPMCWETALQMTGWIAAFGMQQTPNATPAAQRTSAATSGKWAASRWPRTCCSRAL